MLQQIHRPIHRHQPTARLAQTMSLLQLGFDELHEALESALANNPALELVEPNRCPACGRALVRNGNCPVCSASGEEAVIFTSPAQSKFTGLSEAPEAAEQLSLATHLLRQIGPELKPADRPIAAHLLAALDEDGLLANPPGEVAAYFHVTRQRVDEIRRAIQQADPPGCGSISPQEALSVQIDLLKERLTIPAAVTACLGHFSLLARQQYAALARLVGMKEEQVRAAAQFISANLNPYPARATWGQASAPAAVYRSPDVVIRQGNQGLLIVEILLPYAGCLRANPLFQKALREAQGAEYAAWREDWQQAQLLVKCIHQRMGALERVMGRLVARQREFILHGESASRPVTRALLSKELGLHESTISRAVSGKSVQLPGGRIIPLAMFFEPNLTARAALREMVRHESRPLSDDELTEMLRNKGFDVARRTVAKYRKMEGILPAFLRKP